MFFNKCNILTIASCVSYLFTSNNGMGLAEKNGLRDVQFGLSAIKKSIFSEKAQFVCRYLGLLYCVFLVLFNSFFCLFFIVFCVLKFDCVVLCFDCMF